jgi:hypothetical protein
MVTWTFPVTVKQQSGDPASFALLKVFKHGRACFLWWCWDVDNYLYTVQTDLYGKRTLSLEEGTYRLRAEWKGKIGEYVGGVRGISGITIYIRP